MNPLKSRFMRQLYIVLIVDGLFYVGIKCFEFSQQVDTLFYYVVLSVVGVCFIAAANMFILVHWKSPEEKEEKP
jgi:hypothetical protein